MPLLPEGIPEMHEYERLVASERLGEHEAFSRRFTGRYERYLSGDAIGQWSRRWEYPFALEALEDCLGRGSSADGCRVLDAGSGFTFFTFLVADRLRQANVTCVDPEHRLAVAFAAAAAEAEGRVAFRAGDLVEGLHEPDASYDAVICISVLEHLGDRHAALRELHRIVRPGGLVVLTFDVAIDGDYKIRLSDCERLLREVRLLFDGEVADLGRLAERVRGDVLTTRRVAEHEAWRLPWKNRLLSTLGSIRHGFVPRRLGYRNLTVWCGRLVRPG